LLEFGLQPAPVEVAGRVGYAWNGLIALYDGQPAQAKA